MRRTAWLLAVALVLVAGCEKNSPAGTDKTGPDKAASTAAATPAGKACVLVYLRSAASNPYFDAVEDGVRQKARDLGVTLDVRTMASATDSATQAPIAKAMAEGRLDAILIGPGAGKAIQAFVWPSAFQCNVKVLSTDAATPAEAAPVGGLGIDTFIGPDQFLGANKAGSYACDTIKKKLDGGKQNLLFLIGDDSPDSAIRLKGGPPAPPSGRRAGASSRRPPSGRGSIGRRFRGPTGW